MILYILRGVFVLLVASVAMLYILPFQKDRGADFATVILLLGGALSVGAFIIAADVFNRRKKLSSLSGIFLGLLGGLLAAYALSFVVDLVGVYTAPEVTLVQPDIRANSAEYLSLSADDRIKIDDAWKAVDKQTEQRESYLKLLEGVKVIIGLVTCYIGMSLVLQTKDDFRFVLPYVEFAKQVRGNRPILLDTSVIIDGRILDLLSTKIFQGSLIVPKFVLAELQTIADSADKLKRARGRRGLDILQKLQENHEVDITIDESDAEGATVDQKLVSAAQIQQARLMTNDFNLNKLATLRGIDVINLNDLAKALRPVVLPGEPMRVKILKAGESANQGVGYLDDGTMVVVENARGLMGQEIELVVTSSLQTSAGRMIFGRSQSGEAEQTPSTANEPSAATPAASASNTASGEQIPHRQSRPGPSARNPRRL